FLGRTAIVLPGRIVFVQSNQSRHFFLILFANFIPSIILRPIAFGVLPLPILPKLPDAPFDR
ncbi:MAG: hypothetical protein WCK17_10410, partial [Verrucomicrobiota bacterium]